MRAPLTLVQARQLLVGDRSGPGHVLGIDQAKNSGWALVDLSSRRCVLSGEARGSTAHEATIAMLGALPGLDWASTLVVLEDHAYMPASRGMPAATLLSLGDSRGRWCALLSQAGQPEKQRVLAEPSDWRKVLGTSARLPREVWKAQAKLWARVMTGREPASDDEAEAVAIALWGASGGLLEWAHKQPQRRPRRKTA